jgi:hypothetical protein
MAVEEQQDDDIIETDEETPEPEAQADPDDAGDQPAEEGEAEPVAEADEVLVTIGDEEPPAETDADRAPQWVRELRKSHREALRKIREYEERERAAPAADPSAVALPAKPTLEATDYDTEKYEAELEAWYRKRDQFESAKRQAQAQAEEQQKAWQQKLDAYGKAKGALKVRDYDDAESAAMEVLSQVQQASILDGCDNPAQVVYALGKNPKRAKELASIVSFAKFNQEIGKLEAKLKIQPRRQAPAPERSVPTGTAPVSGSSDSTLERLRAEAEKTGDHTKVIRYKQQLKAKQAK